MDTPTPPPVSRSELLDQVRELRRRGQSPKQIARELEMTTKQVAPVMIKESVAGPSDGGMGPSIVIAS